MPSSPGKGFSPWSKPVLWRANHDVETTNWIEFGETSGRGRMDRARERLGAEVKTVLVYPLVKDAPRRLRERR
jgi:uncharacterized protein YaeQ